jgi:pimeloyl-ACP methyl ester carboxylesterase
MRLFNQPWGFAPEEIDIPVHIWHGELDRNVPPIIARRLVNRIPNCKVTFFPNEGHFSLWFNHIEEIIKTLMPKSYTDPIKKVNAHDLILSLR